ncbi:MAG: tetratricopeptide repeat protein [bacterium ADurb.Bin243]|nr:MAG: tetratricopeptide repeat protein [bacterium ADurb.Bin243]
MLYMNLNNAGKYITKPQYSSKKSSAGAFANRIRPLFACLICLFFIAFSAGQSAAQTDELFALYDRAMRAYEKGDYQNAEAYFSKVIKLSPDSTYGTQSAFYLGRALIKLDRQKEALEIWQSFYDKNMFIGNRAELFKLYEQQGLIDRKLAEFEAKIKKSPGDMICRHDYIEFLIFLNRVDEALAQYNYIISVKPSEFYLYKNAGDLLVRFKRYKEALYYYEKLLKMQPDNDLFLEAAGNAYYQLNDVEKARQYWFRIIASSADINRYNFLAGILQAHNMIDDAISVYRLCQKAAGNQTVFFAELAELYEVKDDYKSLIEYYFSVIETMPPLFSAVEQRLAETLKRNIDAREPLCSLISGPLKKIVSQDAQKLRLASLIFLMSKKYENALEINLLLSKASANPVILEDYARTLDALGLYDLSLQALDVIARSYPATAHEYNARFIKAGFLKARKRYDEALKLFEEVKNAKSFSELYHDSLYQSALIYFEGLDMRDRALEIFDALETRSSNFHFESVYFKGSQELFRGNYQTAETMLNKIYALGTHPRSASALALIGYSQLYRESCEAAIEKFNDLIAQYPSYEDAADIFGAIKIIRTAQNDNKEDLYKYFSAEREYRAANYSTAEILFESLAGKESPLKYDALKMLYKTQLKQKKPAAFKKSIEEYIKNAPDDQKRAEAIFELALFYLEKGNDGAAEASARLETILKNYPSALLSNKSRVILAKIKGENKIEKKIRDSFFGYN